MQVALTSAEALANRASTDLTAAMAALSLAESRGVELERHNAELKSQGSDLESCNLEVGIITKSTPAIWMSCQI